MLAFCQTTHFGLIQTLSSGTSVYIPAVLTPRLAPTGLSLLLLCLVLLSGCAGVKVSEVDNQDYLSLRRGDILSTGELSMTSRTALQVIGRDEKQCRANLTNCRLALRRSEGLSTENLLATLSELWLQEALQTPASHPLKRTDAYLESARHAYAYLFMSPRSLGQRALEDRQGQVRDYYNFSVQQAMAALFTHFRGNPPPQEAGNTFHLQAGSWKMYGRMAGIRLARGRTLPKELVPASALSFAGLRNQYRREGLGAELVAVTEKRVINSQSDAQSWSETPFPAITTVARFPGKTLEQVLATDQVEILAYDPYRQDQVKMPNSKVPLAGNFTSGYGLWLARSGFARQSLMTLIGRGDVLETPHVYMLQPYDPNRRVLVMLHGLASSPEAWINVANEVLGDEELRRNYQIWQVYYPTNLPIAWNNVEIRHALQSTLQHFDPNGTAQASHDMVLLGHSMGGVLSRLMVSSSDDQIWSYMQKRYQISDERQRKARKTLAPYVEFEPMPQVSRAIFVAAPHRGTPFAENRLSRWAASLVRLPISVLGRVKEISHVLIDPNAAAPVSLNRGLNSIDNLSDQDPFIISASNLPIADTVAYHSIIGNYTPKLTLSQSSDGVVPYNSSHLPEALSELVVPSWHSVQENPEAILEIRRILHEHLSAQENTAP